MIKIESKKYIYMIIIIFIIMIFSLFIYLDYEKKKEQANLAGICEKTKTNLYETLGKEQFYQLVKRNYLEEIREAMLKFTEKHWKICAEERENCGLYYLSPDNQTLEEYVEYYKKSFEKTGYYDQELYPNTMINSPKHILTKEIALEKINLKEKIKYTEGFFYLQDYRAGRISQLKTNSDNNLFTLEEVKKRKEKQTFEESEKESIYLKEQERINGIGNYYIRLISTVIGTHDRATSFPLRLSLNWNNNDIVAISNCGEVPNIGIYM